MELDSSSEKDIVMPELQVRVISALISSVQPLVHELREVITSKTMAKERVDFISG